MRQLRTGSWKPDPDEAITAADVQARLSGLRERAGAISPRAGRFLLAGVLIAVLAAEGVALSVQNSRYQRDLATTVKQVAAAKASAASASVPDTNAAATARLTRLTTSARKAATSVATGQQRFATLAYRVGKGIPGASSDLLAHRKDLASWWTAASLVVPDSKAYTPVTDEKDLYPTSRIDPRYPWFALYDGTKPTAYTWSVASVWPRQDDPDAVGVVWTCTTAGSHATPGDSGTVLAWATAVYHGTKSRFDDLSLTVTAAGATRLKAGSSAASVPSSPTSSSTIPLPPLPTKKPSESPTSHRDSPAKTQKR